MPGALSPAGGCCTPCDDVPVTNVPGPTGSTGAAGAAGADGVNAYTTTTAAFTMPAAAATVSVAVEDTSWIGVGQYLFIVGAGIMEVTAVVDSNTLTLENSGAAINAAAATVIALGKKVSPSGPEGTATFSGTAAGGDLTGTYVNPTLAIPVVKGDLLTGNAATRQLLNVGADGTSLRADSAQATGLKWEKTDISDATHITGTLAIASGGTGQTAKAAAFDALAPTTTKGDLIVYSNTGDNDRLAVGANNTVLVADSAQTLGVKWAANSRSYLEYQYRLDPNTTGAALTGGAGSWNTVPLNDEVADTSGIGSIAASVVTLPAGSYRFEYKFVIYFIGSSSTTNVKTKGRLFNTNGAGAAIVDTESFSTEFCEVRSADTGTPYCLVTRRGRFTLGASAGITLQAYKTISSTTQMVFGEPLNIGADEVYAVLNLESE